MLLYIYAPITSNRLKYIFHTLLQERLGLTLIYLNDIETYQRAEGAKLNYSHQSIAAQELHIRPYRLLEATNIAPQTISIHYPPNDTPYFFQVTPTKDFCFDVFSAAFFLLSRYEEYLPFQADTHGRFSASQSQFGNSNFLHRPIVEEWVKLLHQKLHQIFPFLIFPASKFTFQPTYDIDLAWAFLHRNWQRTFGGFLNDARTGSLHNMKRRWQVLMKKAQDPYDTYSLLANPSSLSATPVYFFLLGDYGMYDNNISASSPALQQLIQQIDKEAIVGIHPSYRSNISMEQLNKEKQRLERILQKPVTLSRQHFLKLHFPDTYRNLLEVGIKEDYSMGYADAIGFRAGTSIPFFWYDLQQEIATELKVFPFAIMDVTLKSYLKLSPARAYRLSTELLDNVSAVNGIFTTLWHNSSFSEIGGWEAWKTVYLDLVAQANTKNMLDFKE